jgi:predicted phage baseplate assembly protein
VKSDVKEVGNPLPAVGGVVPESLSDIKLLAPTAMRASLERAITADDYAELAATNPKIQRAAATLRWNGSRYMVRVAVDPVGTEGASPTLLKQVSEDLYRYRRVGHDVEVVSAKYVPLDIAMVVQVLAHFHAKEVRGAVLKVFSNRVLAEGTRGVFHPDNLTFGASIELSGLIDRAQRVSGVESVIIQRFECLYLGPNDEIENGVLPIGPLEVGQLDNDPNYPERGRFTLKTRGGR